MKITMEFSKEDIFELIRKQLLASGLRHDMATAKYKGSAKLTIEVEGQLLDVEEAAPAATPPMTSVETHAPFPEGPSEEAFTQVERALTPPPQEEPGDMSAILRASNKNSADKPGIFPAPPRPLMEGESVEWPGAPVPRGR